MTNPIEDISQLGDRLLRAPSQDGLAALATQARTLAERAAQAMSQEASGTDPTGSVTATTRADGTVVSVYISPYAIRDLAPAELGEACVEAVKAARTAVSSQLMAWLASIGHDTGDAEATG